MKAELKIKGTDVRIYVDDLLHISFKQKDLKGIQSWREGPCWYSIEYYLEGSTILTAYDSKEKWEAILKELDSKL